MKWTPKGLILTIIASVIKSQLPPDLALTYEPFINIVYETLSDIDIYETTPEKEYIKTFKKCLRDIFISPNVQIEFDVNIEDIIDDLLNLSFQVESNYSELEVVTEIKNVLLMHGVYVHNINDEIISDIADNIYMNLRNAVLENGQSLTYYVLKKIELLELKLYQNSKYNDLSENNEFSKKWITKREIKQSIHHVTLETENELIKLIREERRITITGNIGGIGKTEVAKSICNSISDNYRYVGWIDYSGNFEQDVIQSLVSDFPNKSKAIEGLLAFDSQHFNELIIFIDNITPDSVLNDFSLSIINQLSCTVVLTSRNNTIFDFVPFEIKVSLEEMCKIFEFYYTGKTNQIKKNDSKVKEIVDLAKYHPLLVELIAKNARIKGLSKNEIINELKKKGFHFSGLSGSNWNNLKNETIVSQLEKLYDFSILTEDSALLRTLKSFYVLPSYPIPPIIYNAINVEMDSGLSSIQELYNMNWIIGDNNSFYMHDIVKSVFENKNKVVAKDCDVLFKHINNLISSEINYNKYEDYIHLLIHAINKIDNQGCTVELAKIYNNLCMIYTNISELNNAEYWNVRALRLFNSLPEGIDTLLGIAVSYCNRGNILLSRLSKSLQYYNNDVNQCDFDNIEKCYNISRRMFDKILKEYKNVDVLYVLWLKVKSINGLSALYSFKGDYNKSLTILNSGVQEKLFAIIKEISLLYNLYNELYNYSENTSKKKEWQNKKKQLSLCFDSLKESFNIDNGLQTNNSSTFSSIDNLTQLALKLENTLYYEHIFSLIKSCDLMADIQFKICNEMLENNKRNNDLEIAKKWADIAICLCSCIFKNNVSPLQGNVYSTAANIEYLMGNEQTAIQLQKKSIQILEEFGSTDNSNCSLEELARAYSNMYAFTSEKEWKKKLNEILEIEN